MCVLREVVDIISPLNYFCHFQSILLADLINDVGDEMSVKTSIFANICLKVSN